MSDLARFLPLSAKRRRDEKNVSRDRAAQSRSVLLALTALLSELSPAEWGAVSAQGAAVIDLVRALVAPARPETTEDAVAAVTSLADDPGRLRSIAALATIVVAALDVARTTGREFEPDPLILGAVALERALAAPYPMRAIARSRTLVAIDGDWRVGRGPELYGTGAEIVLFLVGRAPLPDRPAPPPMPPGNVED